MNSDLFYKKSKQIVFVAATLINTLSVGVAYAAKAEPVDVQPHSDNAQAAIHDTAITAKIKARLQQDRGLKGSDIQVTTTNGVVTLEGMANDSNAKVTAQRRAETVKGVKSVDNNLTVVTSSATLAKSNQGFEEASQAGSDAFITTKVKSKILADSLSRGFDVNVKTEDGVVILSGSLANREAIQRVKLLASQVKGVKSVDTAGLKITPR